jgi:phosphonate transport system substrate-binding protein
MKGNKKNKSNNNDTLPPTSFPSAEDETTFPVPPPQIEGYKILGELGKAGQGRVWRALQLSTHREVALKVPRAGLLHSEKSRARFEREVEVASRLKHPNIARIYDSGIHQDSYYYTMDLIKGIQLNEYIEQHNLTQRQILELMLTVCQAMQHAHQNAVIHRDIKPSNILVTEDGQPHIVDFGLAKYIPGEDISKAISSDGEMVGTPAYMSPEQALGEMERVDTRTDVYSLGAILYVLLTGRNPHDLSGARTDVLHRIGHEEIIRPRKISQKMNKELEAVLLKSLELEPDNRYSCAGDLAKDIDNYLKGEPLSAMQHTAAYFLGKRIRKHYLPISTVCLLLVAFMVGVILPWAIESVRSDKEWQDNLREFDKRHEREIVKQSHFSDKSILRLSFGIYPSDRPSIMEDMFEPTLESIRENVEELLKRPVYIKLNLFPTYKDGVDAIVKGKVDFVRFGPASYIIAKDYNPGIQLLAIERMKSGKKRFYGVIVVRKDSDIYELSDLKDRSFAFGDRNSTIGRYLSQYELAKAGICANDLSRYKYLGSHDAVAEAVLAGQFDAGALKKSTYERYKSEFRVIGEPFMNVTKPWIARAGLNPVVFSNLRKVLLELKDPGGLNEIGVSSFGEVSDSDYDLVRKRMEESTRFFPWWFGFMHKWPTITAVLILVGTVIYVLGTIKRRKRIVTG